MKKNLLILVLIFFVLVFDFATGYITGLNHQLKKASNVVPQPSHIVAPPDSIYKEIEQSKTAIPKIMGIHPFKKGPATPDTIFSQGDGTLQSDTFYVVSRKFVNNDDTAEVKYKSIEPLPAGFFDVDFSKLIKTVTIIPPWYDHFWIGVISAIVTLLGFTFLIKAI
jgi:hypothetical protein